MPRRRPPNPTNGTPPEGADRPVEVGDRLTVLRALDACKREAEEAKRSRMAKTLMNLRAFLGEQDWTYKQAGQSTEFLPKTAIALEQLSQFIKRALTQFGAWFSVEVPPMSPLAAQDVHDLLRCALDWLPNGPGHHTNVELRLSDAVKLGALSSLMILKVHGFRVPERTFVAERGTPLMPMEPAPMRLRATETQPWRLAIDVVRPEDYFPDPTGRHLYEIHTVERDLHEVQAFADQGIYDPAVVEQLVGDFTKQTETWQRAHAQNQDPSGAPDFRKRVVIDEFWGNLLNAEGRIVARNIVCARANERYLLRPPEPNPWWHGESPFVVAPLIRVPGSVWHKALYDDVVPLNLALNELFNLMLDGGIASVWGTRQIRMDWLEDPRQVSGGIPQGATLAVKAEIPQGSKVLENLTEGRVPPEAVEMYRIAEREFQAGSLTNDLKLGFLPPRQIKATEAVMAEQSSAVTLDGMVADIERELIQPLLEKAWKALLQHLDLVDGAMVLHALGPRAALALARLSPAERYAQMAQGCHFRVHGLSATLGKVRDFQKLAAMMQLVSMSPLLLQAFAQRFSADKVLTHLMKTLNVNPEHLEQTPEELAAQPQRLAQLPAFQGLVGAAGPRAGATEGAMAQPEPAIPAEIAQMANPMTGLAGP